MDPSLALSSMIERLRTENTEQSRFYAEIYSLTLEQQLKAQQAEINARQAEAEARRAKAEARLAEAELKLMISRMPKETTVERTWNASNGDCKYITLSLLCYAC